jgi:peptidoglycan/xylan/chitin deacetylase (PgdA/CDA1 family)
MHHPMARRRLFGLCVGSVALAACTAPATPRRAQPPPTGAAPLTAARAPVVPSAPGSPATEVVRSETGRPQVALTFHGAGEVGLARQVLDVLARHGAGVTVLAVGTWLAANPQVARMILDGGHELGNHTWSHPALAGYAPEPMYAQIRRCRDTLVELTGSPGAFFRQSQGRRATQQELQQAGRAGYSRVLSYDVDCLDWRDPDAAAIRSAVATARAGSVVSLHLGHPGTLAALPAVLTDLADRGLTPVTATELLG